MEWDPHGGVVLVQVEVQAEEAEVLVGWAATAPELARAEIVFVLIVGRGCHIKQVSPAII
jgi:hypothetical protein